MKKSGFIARFDIKSLATNEPVLKYYDVATEAEAITMAERFKSISQATKFEIMPMSNEFNVKEVTDCHNNTWNVVTKVA